MNIFKRNLNILLSKPTKEIYLTVTRFLVALSMFICLTYIKGINTRIAQQVIYQILSIVIFSMFLGNIWLTLFTWWTVFLYTYFKFQVGDLYVSNILFGLIVYYAVKVSFRKKHVDNIIKVFMWLVGINCIQLFLQSINYDILYSMVLRGNDGTITMANHSDFCGFMGLKAAMGVLMATAIPVVASRNSKIAPIVAALLMIPIFISRSSICFVGGAVGLIYALWFRIKKWIWTLIVGLMILAGTLFIVKVDAPMGTLGTRPALWKVVLNDSLIHPITGWGLDSFRQTTEWKKHEYAMNPQKTGDDNLHIDVWDNPHNIFVSLFFEWGILGVVFLGCFINSLVKKVRYKSKSPNVIALSGFALVLLIVSMAQFPLWLGRCAAYCIPMIALLEVELGE